MYITQFRDSLPRRAAGRGVFPLSQELLGFFVDLFLRPVDFAVVRFVEGVDVFACCGDRLLFFLLRDFVAFGEVGVAFGAPGADGFRVFCVVLGRSGGGVVGGGLGCVGYGAAGSDCL